MTTSTEWREASSSPSPPLEAVRTVYPKLSRNALSQSSTSWFWSMQRTTPLGISESTDGGMDHLRETSFQYLGRKACARYSTIIRPLLSGSRNFAEEQLVVQNHTEQ